MSYNPGLLYYKHYYENFPYHTLGDNSDNAKKAQAKHFGSLNQKLLGTSFNPQWLSSVKKSFGQADNTSVQDFSLVTTYPGLLIGTGYTHGLGALGEFKIGFYFDYTTGMPVIPGSSVKGLLRSAFPLLYAQKAEQLRKKGKTEDADFWDHLAANRKRFITAILTGLGFPADDGRPDFVERLEREVFEGLHGHNRERADHHFPMSDRDVFYEAVVTGARSGHVFRGDNITPHNKGAEGIPAALKNPIPISMLKVSPQVTFCFQFGLKSHFRAPDGNERKPRLLTVAQRLELFRQVILFLGAGAKTNTGYGKFEPVDKVRFKTTTTNRKEEDNVVNTPTTPVYRPLKKGDKVEAVVVEDPNTPAQHIALQLLGGAPDERHVAYVKFPAGRAVGTKASEVRINDLKPPIKVEILKW